jgi:class 3 adenylate cyclase
MGLDEAGAARILREHRVIADAVVAKHGGRIVKTTGDGILLEFPSVVDAVECAVAIQTVMAERNDGVPEDRKMLFRIGMTTFSATASISRHGLRVLPQRAASASRVPRMIRFAARSQSSSPIWASRNSRISLARYEPTPWSGMDLVAGHRPAARHQGHHQPRGCPSWCCRSRISAVILSRTISSMG